MAVRGAKRTPTTTHTSATKATPKTARADAEPTAKRHGKCVEEPSGVKKATKKKSGRKSPGEVVKFVEGDDSGRKLAKKNRKYNTEVRFLEHKFIQCNINKESDDADVTLPDDIKPLLINVTFLLHELKQRPESKNREDLCNFISRIATLVTELSRRPIKKVDERSDHAKTFDEIATKLGTVLRGQSGAEDEEYANLVEEIRHLEDELIQKNSEVNYVRDQIVEERARLMSRDDGLENCLRNSIIKNQSLRAEIKFNRAQFKKYSKVMMRKEQQKQKSDMELMSLRKKVAKQEQSMEGGAKVGQGRSLHAEADVFRGGSVTKYIKSKVTKDKSHLRRKSLVTKNRLPAAKQT